jgi:hypothetical protein
MATQRRHFTYDPATEMKDAGAVTTSAAAEVESVAKVLDLGAGRVDAIVVVDVTDIDTTTLVPGDPEGDPPTTDEGGDEKYEIEFQVSNSASFSTGNVCAAVLKLGALTAGTGSSADSATGRYELHVTNEINHTRYRYARLYTRVAGAAPSIDYTAFLGKAEPR